MRKPIETVDVLEPKSMFLYIFSSLICFPMQWANHVNEFDLKKKTNFM